MAEYWGVKVEDLFNTMQERFRVEGAKGVDASYGYDIEGAGRWRLDVKNGSMEIKKTDDLEGCVSIMKTDQETFVGINIGKVDGAGAFTSGKVVIEGNLTEFGKTSRMFKKYVAKTKQMSTRDYILDMFGTVEKRFKPEASKGLDFIIQIEAGGDAGGVWSVYIKDGTCKVVNKPADNPTVSLEIMEAQDWVDLTLGKTDAQTLLASGKGAVRGDIAMAMKWGELFEKYEDPMKDVKKEMSTRDYILDMFDTVEKRFKPEASKGLDFIIQIEAGGDAGGVWSVYIKDGTCKVVDKPADNPTVSLEIMEAQDWVDLTLGKTDAQTLLASGKGSVKGEIAMAMKWGELFEKYVDPMAGVETEQELIVLKKTISVEQKFSTGPVIGKFLNALKDKKILVNQCKECGRIQIPAREVCAECRIRVNDFIEVGPKGHVRYMEYVMFASPDPLTGATRETPYGMANILLDGCHGHATFAHLIRRDQIDKIKNGKDDTPGTRVRPVWRDDRVGNIFDIQYFEIDE